MPQDACGGPPEPGGGSEDGSRYAPGSLTNQSIVDSVDAILGDGTHCNTDVTNQFGTGGGSIADLEKHISGATIYDTTIPAVGNMTITAALGVGAGLVGGQGVTLSQYINQNSAVAAVPYLSYSNSSSYQLSSGIVIGAAFFTQNIVLQQADLVHEILHVYTGLNDAGLASALGLQLSAGYDPSIAIRNYLRSDCTLKKF